MTSIVVYVHCTAIGGGTFQYAQEVLEALSVLSRQDWKVYVYYLSPEWGNILQRLGLDGEQLRGLHGPKKYLSAISRRAALLLPETFRHALLCHTFPSCCIIKHNPDVVIVPEQYCLYLPKNIRQIAAIHDLMHIYEPSFPEVGTIQEQNARNKVYSNIVRHCSDIFADSPLGKQHILENFAARSEQIHVLPFVPPTRLQNIPPQAPAQKMPGSFFFYPAQFWKHKNHVRLVEACRIALESIPELHCVFVGSTKYDGYKDTQASIIKNSLEDKITVLGYVDDAVMRWLFCNAQFMIYPSFFGPTNIPPLEAMALGCPLAVSERYAMPWQCGDAALYFDPDNEQDIAHAIMRLWRDENLRSTLKSNGLERAKEWTQKHLHQRIEQLLYQGIV